MSSYDEQIQAAKRALENLKQEQRDAVFITLLPVKTIIEVMPDGRRFERTEPIPTPCVRCGEPAATIKKEIDGKMVYRNKRRYDGYSSSYGPFCDSCFNSNQRKSEEFHREHGGC